MEAGKEAWRASSGRWKNAVGQKYPYDNGHFST